MGVEITKCAGEIAARLKNADMTAAFRAMSKELVTSAVRKINAGVAPENAPLTQSVKRGNKTLRDTGALMASIAPQNGRDWAAAQTNLPYARMMQEGGTVTAKGRALALPASSRTRKLMREFNAQKPRELVEAMKAAGYSVFVSKKAGTDEGGVLMAKKGTRGKPFALFIIRRSVKIPARPFLYIDEKDERFFTRLVQKAVHEALQQPSNGGKA